MEMNNGNYKIERMIGIIIFVILSLITNTKVEAASTTNASPTSSSILKIFYFKDNTKALTSLFLHPSYIDVLAPQAYSIDDSGALTGTIDPTILSFTQKNNIKMMPLVANKGFSKSTAEAILDDPSKQDLAINSLITEAGQQKYWGWQMDFEQIDASYKNKYSTFIEKMSAAFKVHNLVLSVAVIAQISSNPSDYPNDLWNRIIGVYDYSSLSSNADFVTVMSYDDPSSTGPIAPYPWLEEVINYSLKFIPAGKLSLGIPLYDWKWNNTSGKLIGIGGYTDVQNTLKRQHATTGYSIINQAPFIKYTIKKNHYEVWYENAKSVAKKISLIKQYGLQGFSAWVLGLETPNVYSVKDF
jgi:spore germination protein YaaH